jgi:hypothetical protein
MSELGSEAHEYDSTAAAHAAGDLPHVSIGNEGVEEQEPAAADYADSSDTGVLGVGFEDSAEELVEPGREPTNVEDADESFVTKAARAKGLFGDSSDTVVTYSGALGGSEESERDRDTRGVSERIKDIGATAREAAEHELDGEVDLSDPVARRAFLGDELADAYEELGLGDVEVDTRSVETVSLDRIIELGQQAFPEATDGTAPSMAEPVAEDLKKDNQ